MTPINTSVLVFLLCLAMPGCDSKSQKQQAVDDAVVAEFSEFSEQNKQRMSEQIESEDGYFSDTTGSLGELAEMMDSASEKVSPELAAQLKAQALIMKEFEGLMKPYLELNNQFYELGGIDAATLGSIEDIGSRISVIQKLAIMNDQIDVRFAELFMQITGADTPDGQRQLAMAKEIRQADRDAYPHMMKSLQIVRKYWETSGNADDGLFYFGNDVPAEEIELYNQHLRAVEEIGQRQLDIQRKYYNGP